MKTATAALFAVSVSLAPLLMPTASSPPPPVERVVFDVDLTRGDAGPGRVSGGEWDRGWRTTGADNERIVFDAGAPISNGRLEVSVTINGRPWAHQQGKINWAGLHEDASLSQNAHGGDLFYARTGNESYKFSNVKAAGRRFDRTEYEPRIGETADWVTDDRTVMTVGFEWRDGVPIFHDPLRRVTVFPRDIVGADTPVDRLRYVFLGSDTYTGLTVNGLRFTRAKLVDYGPGADGPPPTALRVSDNGRALVDAGGRAVFLLTDTAWSLVNRLTRQEITAYLERRRAQRFNAVTFVLHQTGDSNQADSLKNAYGDGAFGLTGGKPDPMKPLETPGADPDIGAAYDYWDHVDFAVAETRRLGLYALVLPTWGSGVTGAYDGKPTADIVFDERNAGSYGRWLGARYGAEPHVIWMLGGDRSAHYAATGTDYRRVFSAMAAGLGQDGGRALRSYHPQKRAPQSGDWFHQESWLAFNSIQHWPEDQLAVIERDWSARPAKPTWLFEGRYEGYYKNNYTESDWGEWQMRQQAWQTVFAGAFGHTYGHERVFGFGKDGADWKRYLEAAGAKSMTHLARFMNSLKHNSALTRVPGQSLLAGNEGQAGRLASDRITATWVPDGHLAMFYSAGGRPIRVTMDKLSGPVNAWWFNPRTGRWHVNGVETAEMARSRDAFAAGPGAAERVFDPPTGPGPGLDWVLVLCRNEALF